MDLGALFAGGGRKPTTPRATEVAVFYQVGTEMWCPSCGERWARGFTVMAHNMVRLRGVKWVCAARNCGRKF